VSVIKNATKEIFTYYSFNDADTISDFAASHLGLQVNDKSKMLGMKWSTSY
jgi:hypothetical protein